MISYRATAVFFLAWGVISALGFVANLDSTQSDNFTDITESAFSVEGVTLDDAPLGSSDVGLSSVIELPKTTGDWILNIGKAATFQSPIWDDGWANMARVVLASIGGAYLLVISIKGLEILISAIRG